MFGYLISNPDRLSEQERKTYKDCYCGLCHQLYMRYGNIGRSTLSYDLTFVTLLLSGISETNDTHDTERCPVHLLKRHSYWHNEFTDHAAKMNLVMSYYKYLDDYHDDNIRHELAKAEKLKGYIAEIRSEYPEAMTVIETNLARISELEEKNTYAPDLLANLFGEIMSQLFLVRQDEHTETLKAFGFQLGKFIYLMDAYLDFRDDLKKQRFNPLVRTDLTVFPETLELVMSDCMNEYDKLPVMRYNNILDSVLLSGIWMAYDIHTRKERKQK